MSDPSKNNDGQDSPEHKPLLGQPSGDGLAKMGAASEPKPDPQLKEDLGRFMDDCDKTAHKHERDLKLGFYSESDADLQRHHIDDDDYKSHRSGEFPHVHHVMSSRDPDPSHGHHHRRHRHRGSRKRTKSEGIAHIPSDVPEGSEDQVDGSSLPGGSEPNLTRERASTTSNIPVTSAPELTIPIPGSPATASVSSSSIPATPTLPPGTLAHGSVTSGSSPAQKGDVRFFVGDPDAQSIGSNIVPSQENLAKSPPLTSRPSKVTFDPNVKMTATPSPSEETDQGKQPPSQSHRHHRKHRHHHHGQSAKDLSKRRHRGSEVRIKDMPQAAPTEEEEASTLAGADLDNMATHRFYDPRGLRRRKISHHSAMASIVHIGKAEELKGKLKRPPRTNIDHSPHEMFVELDELYLGEDLKYAWQEKARWIKFEEDLEEGADRFGKPHVASLSFHSLLELRRCIEHGVIVLDLEDDDLPSIVSHVVDQLVTADQLPETSKGSVIQALLLKHRHVRENKSFLSRNMSSEMRGSFKSLSLSFKPSSASLASQGTAKTEDSVDVEAGKLIDQPNGTDSNAVIFKNGDQSKSAASFGKRQESSVSFVTPEASVSTPKMGSHPSSHILNRIPKGAEATTVLVGSVDFLDKPIMAFVRLSEGQYLENLTEVPLPVRFLFMLMGPSNASMDYLEIGRSISTLMANKIFHDVAYKADGRSDLLDAINEFLDDSLVLPPGEVDRETLLPIMHMARRKAMQKKKRLKEIEEVSEELIPKESHFECTCCPTAEEKPILEVDPLMRTGKIFGGLIQDIKRRYPKYLSDIKDGLNPQCLAVFFFIYFACLSPAITFGGLLGEVTEKWMGVSEMLIGTSVLGVIFALLAGQPLTIMGATGPVLVFEAGLYQFCQGLDIEYLPMRFWVMAWLTIIALLMVMFEGTVFVRYFTLFTEEIFASLISLIFIYEVFKKLYVVFTIHPLAMYSPPTYNTSYNSTLDVMYSTPTYDTSMLDDVTNSSLDVLLNATLAPPTEKSEKLTNQPNTALLSVILTMSTFALAYFLKHFRNSKFLGRGARRAIGDFGVPISIAIMVMVDYIAKEVYTEKLDVPDGLTPTASYKRGWLINPLGLERPLPWWIALVSFIPALLVFILIFMETQITSLIVNKKDRNLQKGSGYHLDLFLIGIFATFSGLFGLPLLCAAAVRSVAHVSALTVYSRTHAPGEKPKLLGVTEQRITALCVHIMVGISVMMGPILRQVPLAVLFGVFLYMGVASMSGIQFFERISLYFVPVKHHPDVGYVRHVKTWRMHLFTTIQLVCLAVLWAVKSTAAALAFPFILLLTVPIRKFILPRVFSERELKHLDKGDEDEDSDCEEDEPDFYEQSHMPI